MQQCETVADLAPAAAKEERAQKRQRFPHNKSLISFSHALAAAVIRSGAGCLKYQSAREGP
jgi:hypothetical protein